MTDAWIDIDPSAPPPDGWYWVRWSNDRWSYCGVIHVIDECVSLPVELTIWLAWASSKAVMARQMWTGQIDEPPQNPYIGRDELVRQVGATVDFGKPRVRRTER